MAAVSVLALLIWVAVLSRAAWLVAHPHHRPHTAATAVTGTTAPATAR